MKKSEEAGNDRLVRFLDVNSIEKAPPDFTTGLMMRVVSKTHVQRVRNRQKSARTIPIFSILITISLIFLVIILPEENSHEGSILSLQFLRAIELPSISLDLNHYLTAQLTNLILYILAGIVLVTGLDIILSRLFYKNLKG
jgi:hypothetical protein